MESCSIRKSSKVKPSRDFDVLYDPTLCLPTKKDYKREVDRAATMATTFAIRPHYHTMFSDTRSRQELISRKPDVRVHENIDSNETKLSAGATNQNVTGANRPLFFRQPLPIPRPCTASTLPPLPESLIDGELAQRHIKSETPQNLTKSTQTDYRETETQTSPWAHDVLAQPGTKLLNLHWFTAGKNCPTGTDEVCRIQRDSQKQAWDEVLSRLRSVDLEQWAGMTEAIISNDNAAKESNLDSIHAHRMTLATRKLSNTQIQHWEELKVRLQRLFYMFEANNSEKVRYMKHQLRRGLRKLVMKQNKVERRYKKRNILTEYRDKASEVYAPQMRFGENPSRRNQIIDVQCQYLNKYKGVEILEDIMSNSGQKSRGFDFNKASKVKSSAICSRKTGGNAMLEDDWDSRIESEGPNKMQEEFMQALLTKREMLVETPGEADDEEWETHEKLSSILLKTAIEGRTTQTEAEALIEKLKLL